MSGFLALGLVAIGLVAVALIILAMDVARGDVGGHHTMERARRLLIVATGRDSLPVADAWIERQRLEHPRLQCFVLVAEDDHDGTLAVEEAVERDRPDALVVVRPPGASRSALEGLYGRLKESLPMPVDAIYADDKVTTR
jgi:hypothetical protein